MIDQMMMVANLGGIIGISMVAVLRAVKVVRVPRAQRIQRIKVPPAPTRHRKVPRVTQIGNLIIGTGTSIGKRM
jgi:hypothetical protein